MLTPLQPGYEVHAQGPAPVIAHFNTRRQEGSPLVVIRRLAVHMQPLKVHGMCLVTVNGWRGRGLGGDKPGLGSGWRQQWAARLAVGE